MPAFQSWSIRLVSLITANDVRSLSFIAVKVPAPQRSSLINKHTVTQNEPLTTPATAKRNQTHTCVHQDGVIVIVSLRLAASAPRKRQGGRLVQPGERVRLDGHLVAARLHPHPRQGAAAHVGEARNALGYRNRTGIAAGRGDSRASPSRLSPDELSRPCANLRRGTVPAPTRSTYLGWRHSCAPLWSPAASRRWRGRCRPPCAWGPGKSKKGINERKIRFECECWWSCNSQWWF